MDVLTIAQARRVALAAQGLSRARPAGGAAPTARRVAAVVERLGVLQIDSVNVVARAHLMALYSRLGPYDVAMLDHASGRAPRRIVEAWAHEASYVPVSTFPLLAWRRGSVSTEAWKGVAAVAREHPGVVSEVRRVVAERGPVTAAQVQSLFETAHPSRRTAWGWNWGIAKTALEYLFFTGEVLAASRTPSFERRYDLADRVLPPAVRAAAPVGEADGVRALLEIGARAHGIGTPRCFRDYFRLRSSQVKGAFADLLDAGVLRPVRVLGWDEPTYLHADAVVPRRASASTLLSPFDPLAFERTRLERLFGMRYRIEIYVPAAKRVHGYYVLPFLQGDALTARVDLKADRGAGVLRVASAWGERETTPRTSARLARELWSLAGWLGLDRIEVGGGDLSADLARALAASSGG